MSKLVGIDGKPISQAQNKRDRIMLLESHVRHLMGAIQQLNQIIEGQGLIIKRGLDKLGVSTEQVAQELEAEFTKAAEEAQDNKDVSSKEPENG